MSGLSKFRLIRARVIETHLYWLGHRDFFNLHYLHFYKKKNESKYPKHDVFNFERKSTRRKTQPARSADTTNSCDFNLDNLWLRFTRKVVIYIVKKLFFWGQVIQKIIYLFFSKSPGSKNRTTNAVRSSQVCIAARWFWMHSVALVSTAKVNGILKD